MDKARLDIENKLVPKGAEVARHLVLPTEGKSPEWILEEMDKMDVELGTRSNWRHGKLSGAVYRAYYNIFSVSLTQISLCQYFRWR
jgi:sphinganine-1-phosphate aldolase